MKRFNLRQGESLEKSCHIEVFIGDAPSGFHTRMVEIMERTMLVPKAPYMRSWYHDFGQTIRVYDYGCKYDFFYLVELGEPYE